MRPDFKVFQVPNGSQCNHGKWSAAFQLDLSKLKARSAKWKHFVEQDNCV